MRDIAPRFQQQLRRSRMTLFSLMPFALLAAASGGFLGFAQPVLRLIYIVAGFSLIIFFHELGHFLVARACSVKCLAFSIGIGPRMLGWRKGTSLSFGNDPYDPETRNKAKKGEKNGGNWKKVRGATAESPFPPPAAAPPHPPTVGDCD